MASPSTRHPNGVQVSGTGDSLSVTIRGTTVTFTAAQLFEILLNGEENFPFAVG
jgi:hypothetical protein